MKIGREDQSERPTEAEIRQRADEVQAGWTPEVERQRRTGTSTPQALGTPIIKTAEVAAARRGD